MGVIPFPASGQNVGKLAGTVRDAATGDVLPGATVFIEQTRLGTAADANGAYFIIGVPVGSYVVRSSYVGFSPQAIEGVEIHQGFTRELDFELKSEVAAFDEIVVQYERPLIQKDAIGTPKVLTSSQLEALPVRGVGAVAGVQAGVVRTMDGSLHFRGGRDDETVLFVDGVKVIGQSGIPQAAIQEQEMLIGSLPAKYGDAQSGVISVTTKSGGTNYFGSLEGITSNGLDDYGYRLASASFGGPLVGDKLSFFAAGEFTHYDDRDPRAIEVPRLTQDRLDFLEHNPQVLRFRDIETGDKVFLPLPGDLPKTVDSDSNGVADQVRFSEVLAAMGIREGLEIDSPTPINAEEVEPLSSYVFDGDQPNYFRDSYVMSGNLTFTGSEALSTRVTGRYQRTDAAFLGTGRGLTISNERLTRGRDETLDLGATITHRISGASFYQIRAGYTRYWANRRDPAFSSSTEDLLSYGDIDNPANSVAARYLTWVAADSTYKQSYLDGRLVPGGGVFGRFDAVGTGLREFSKVDRAQITAAGNATVQVGLHQLEFGAELERRTERGFVAFPVDLARYFDDGLVEAGQENAVSAYGQIPFYLVADQEYFGYDYLGIRSTNQGDVDTFITGALGACNERSDSPSEACDTPPYKPIRYAGYIQDKIEYRDLVLNLGLRADVFDPNTIVLKDPYALVPIVRAGDLGADVPSTIGPEFAVYFGGGDQVAGYRDLDGRFFDANGEPATAQDIVAAANVRVPEGVAPQISSDVFEDSKAIVTWMPRIGVSFPVTDQSLFFAHYDKTSQQPRTRVFPGINEYYRATQGSEVLENSALRPQTTTEYELGFRMRLGARSAFLISGFYKSIDNLTQVEWRTAAYPNTLITFENNDFGTVKGVELEYDLRRTHGLTLNANYTLQFARGTGSDPISSRFASFPPDFIFPLNFDRRHAVNLNADYRVGRGEGPSLAGRRILEDFGVNIVASLYSGLPYTPRSWPALTVQGALNGARMPWSTQIDLRLDRRFQITPRISMTAFLWIENLFDVDNVVAVYPTTGLPDTDGWTLTGPGREALRNDEARICGGECSGQIQEIAAAVYGFSTNAPSNYGIPRLTRLGLKLNL